MHDRAGRREAARGVPRRAEKLGRALAVLVGCTAVDKRRVFNKLRSWAFRRCPVEEHSGMALVDGKVAERVGEAGGRLRLPVPVLVLVAPLPLAPSH